MTAKWNRKRLNNMLQVLCDKRCWYVSCGGSAGHTFELFLGAKIKRPIPLGHKSLPPALRRAEQRLPLLIRMNDPEYSLLVWSAWRILKKERIIASSRDDREIYIPVLNGLRSRKIVAIGTPAETTDVRILFDNKLTLDIFCDSGTMLPTTSPIDRSYRATNWEVFVPGDILVAV